VEAFRPVNGRFTRLRVRYSLRPGRYVETLDLSRAPGFWTYVGIPKPWPKHLGTNGAGLPQCSGMSPDQIVSTATTGEARLAFLALAGLGAECRRVGADLMFSDGDDAAAAEWDLVHRPIPVVDPVDVAAVHHQRGWAALAAR
jgi:hypothetical protein